MIRKLFILLFVSMILGSNFSSFGFGLTETYEGLKTVKVNVNNKLIIGDVPAVVLNGRTMVPLKFASEALGYSAFWNPMTNVAFIKSNNFPDRLMTGEFEGRKIANVFVNNALLVGDVPPIIINGRTMIPLKLLSESLGAVVTWDSQTRTVNITTKPSDDLVEGELPTDFLGLTSALYRVKDLINRNYTRDQILVYLSNNGYSEDIRLYAVDNHSKIVENQTNEHAVNRAKEVAYLFDMKILLSNFLYHEGFSRESIDYGVENCGVEWVEESVLIENNLKMKALSRVSNYLNKNNHSSRVNIMKLLRFWGFSEEVAIETTNNKSEFNWMRQAELRAIEILDYFPTTESLINQLMYEGFTYEEASNGANFAKSN